MGGRYASYGNAYLYLNTTGLIQNEFIFNTLKIFVQSFSIDAETKLKLKIPQLTLGELAQMDMLGNENLKVLVQRVQFRVEANFLLKLIYPSL